MKAGDLVLVIGSHEGLEVTAITGVLIKEWKIKDWWEVMTSKGQIINWPEAQMEVISENRCSS